MGALPQIYAGNRTKADNFIDKVKAYLCLNKDIAGFDLPYKKVAFTLTLIKGKEAAQWVRDIGNWLNGLNMPQDNIPAIWTQFLDEFTQQFQDTQAPQRARNEIMDLRMQDDRYDEYVAKFKSLARRASYTQGNKETFNMFLRGLPKNLIHNAIKPLHLQTTRSSRSK
jgi:hypothetical protein